jgi:hypothetical protein
MWLSGAIRAGSRVLVSGAETVRPSAAAGARSCDPLLSLARRRWTDALYSAV